MHAAPLEDSAMTDVDIVPFPNILPHVGWEISDGLIPVVVGSVFHGTYFSLLLVSVYSITRRAKWWRSVPALALLTTIVIMFGLSTFLWAFNVHLLWKLIGLLIHAELGSINEKIWVFEESAGRNRYTKTSVFVIEYLIGDALLGWRVFVLYRCSRVVVGGLSLLWIGSAASGLGLVNCSVKSGDLGNDFLLADRCRLFEFTSWAISVAFNLMATILLAIVAWNHRKTANAAHISHKTKVDRVLYILVASGSTYLILACLRLVFYTDLAMRYYSPDLPWVQDQRIRNVLDSIFNQVIGIYPTLVTALVLNERSLFGSQSPTYVSSGRQTQSQSIMFRRDTVTSTSDTQLHAIPLTRLDTIDEASSSCRRSPSVVSAVVEQNLAN